MYLTSPTFNSSAKSNRLFLLQRRKYFLRCRILLFTVFLLPDNPTSWMKQRDKLNRRRKPSRRVPITAPPTRITKTTTTTTTTSTRKTTTTTTAEVKHDEAVVSAPVFYDNHGWNKPVSSSVWCQARQFRGIAWPHVQIGTTQSMPCPQNKNNKAQWTCVEADDKNVSGIWQNGWPNMDQCQSSWVRKLLLPGLSVPQSNHDHAKILKALVSQSLRHLSVRPVELFGGDILPILDVLDENLDVAADGLPAEEVHETIKKSITTLNHLLDSRSVFAWMDVSHNEVIGRQINAKVLQILHKASLVASKTNSLLGNLGGTSYGNAIRIQMGNNGNFSNMLPLGGIYTASNLCKFRCFIYFLLFRFTFPGFSLEANETFFLPKMCFPWSCPSWHKCHCHVHRGKMAYFVAMVTVKDAHARRRKKRW